MAPAVPTAPVAAVLPPAQTARPCLPSSGSSSPPPSSDTLFSLGLEMKAHRAPCPKGAFLSLSHLAACGHPHSWLLRGLPSAPVTGPSHLPSGFSSSVCLRVCDVPSVCSCLVLCSLSLFRGRATVQGLAKGHLVSVDAQTHVSTALSRITAAGTPIQKGTYS